MKAALPQVMNLSALNAYLSHVLRFFSELPFWDSLPQKSSWGVIIECLTHAHTHNKLEVARAPVGLKSRGRATY
eukprot:5625284-Amphidinium_carterae.1